MSNKQFIVAIVAVAGFLCNILLWLQIGSMYALANPGTEVAMGSAEMMFLTLGAALGFAVPVSFAMLNPVLEEKTQNE